MLSCNAIVNQTQKLKVWKKIFLVQCKSYQMRNFVHSLLIQSNIV